ncbi:uncharacterized protein FSUBG_7859 [Fusarium subglutinans]|uniref:Uncharacterized protein n=1 Tax=Gibberella subglutinans TaxID=42677 RepID=A0A8H5PSP8_GIBSU|nr:uncharacterized protein FSUBG_7859 [Fusarium subglutinans]KAF5602184.1 hypothetical protein FSUBG_7859 [Fusarium subglutinans]
MAMPSSATSILELLTHPNPSVSHQIPKSKTNSRSLLYYCPKQLKRWQELEDVNILKDVFGGVLLKEACRRGRTLDPYPRLHSQADCIIRNEDDTRDLIHKWNKSVVTAALDPIQDLFHPVIWSKGDPPSSKEVYPSPPRQDEKKRHQPLRKRSPKATNKRLQSLSRLQPDSGSIASRPVSSKADGITISTFQERFPKEYKISTKWKSERVFRGGLLDDSGGFIRGKTNDNSAWPIRQAYTYCIQHMCRYGCILTAEEAFIFRIMPREDKSSKNPQNANLLRNELINNGLMEYVSIPWENCSQGQRRSLDVWTVNLALWFMHVLAGNNFEVEWSYVDLTAETLVASQLVDAGVQPEAAGTVDSNDGQHGGSEDDNGSTTSEESEVTEILNSSTAKRKRDSDDSDFEGIHLSFSKRQFV